MQPEFLRHVFDSFSRERDSRVDRIEGTGLGMAITKKIVELMNGDIEVESEPGKGTTFRITMPMVIEEAPPIAARFPDLRVIVADDDAVMCEYTVEMLYRLGVRAEWVNSGEQAIERIEEAGRKGEAYDAVILDWKMPGKDGLQTTRHIRDICGAALPVLIISAYDWSDIEQEAVEAGVSGFLGKPVFVSTLCRGLQRYVLGKEPTILDAKEQLRRVNFTGRRFLLVEGNSLNQEVAEELLRAAGASVDIAGDGLQGVQRVAESAEGTYDLILMDIQMPVMDGYTASRRIRELKRSDARSVPILAMTADAFAEDIQLSKEAGMDGHLAKPLDEAALKREIGKYL